MKQGQVDQIDEQMRDRVAKRLSMSLIPAVGMLALLTIIVQRLFYPEQGGRVYAAYVVLILVVPGIWFWYRGQWRRAAAMLVTLLFLAMVVAMTVSGGPLAPGYLLCLPLTAILGWLYGERAAWIFAVVSVLAGVCFALLLRAGILPAPPPVNYVLVITMIIVVASLLTLTAVVPYRMAKDALLDSERNRLDLLTAQERERQSHAAFDAILDQTFGLISFLNVDGSVIRTNGATQRFIAAKEEEIVGRLFWEAPWWSLEDRALVREAVESAASGVSRRFHVQSRDAAGRQRDIDCSVGPYFLDGRVAYIISEGRDITDLVRTEERLKMVETARERILRLESVGLLAAGISHDFNNILGIILANAQLIQKAHNVEERSAARLEAIAETVHRGSRLVRQLLDFSGRKPAGLQSLAIQDLLPATVNMAHELFPKNITIQIAVESSLPHILFDPSMFEQVILNLLINARDAMPPSGGSIDFAAAPLPAEQRVELIVTDTGAGMDPDTLRRVFDPYFTTKTHGTGLGLPVVYGNMHACGGTVDVYSRQGSGTQFRLTFKTASDPTV
ncbi:MAG: PAS domain-containing protein [Spirochaetia bacterium]|nr:PAS domain-containing protein [Spirochaetia bacterium]